MKYLLTLGITIAIAICFALQAENRHKDDCQILGLECPEGKIHEALVKVVDWGQKKWQQVTNGISEKVEPPKL